MLMFFFIGAVVVLYYYNLCKLNTKTTAFYLKQPSALLHNKDYVVKRNIFVAIRILVISGENMMENDLFEMLKNMTGCEYISDLRFGENNEKAQACFNHIDINRYSLPVLSDAAAYIFGADAGFVSYGDAIDFFQSKKTK